MNWKSIKDIYLKVLCDNNKIKYLGENKYLLINKNGDKHWYLNGKLHREGGPAVEYIDGTKCWYLNGKLHREDGPAIEYANGGEEWYIHGFRHRENGPAFIGADGFEQWYNNGEYVEEPKESHDWEKEGF